MNEEHQSALDLRIVAYVHRLRHNVQRGGTHRQATLCADVATFLQTQPGFDGVTQDDVTRAFKRPDKHGVPTYLRSIGHYNLPDELADMEPEALRRHLSIENTPQPKFFYLGDTALPDTPYFNPRKPHQWLRENLRDLSNRHAQGLPFSVLFDAMQAAGVAEHAPGYPMHPHEIPEVLDFTRIVQIMEKGDGWPMMEYANDVPISSTSADPRHIEKVYGVRWKPDSYLHIPSRERLRVILCRNCNNGNWWDWQPDDLDNMERHDPHD